MIPVYPAIEFLKIMEGGSTRPWLLNALVDGKPMPYVVKLYSEKNNEDNNTVLKECICSRLANEFDIQTPAPALIEFGHDFVNNVLPDELREVLRTKDSRLKFATKLIDSGYENYSPQLSEKYLRDYDLATVYAFDNLILNVDRRVDKPNLFFQGDNCILLDHELTLSASSNAIKDIQKKRWTHNYSRHIFFSNLASKLQVKGTFDTFQMYLESLTKFDFLNAIYDQLEDNGHPVNQYYDISSYFSAVKSDPKTFVDLIKSTVA